MGNMPPVRTAKLSSTDRRKCLADKIDQTGFPAMAPCPQCVSSGSHCIVRKGASCCLCCLRKNVAYGGTFSDAKFDALENQKTDLLRKKVKARSRLTSLAWGLLSLQKEHDSLDKKLDRIHNRQEKMIEEEARALEELDTFTGDPEPLAVISSLDFNLGSELSSWILAGVEEPQPPDLVVAVSGSGDSPLKPPAESDSVASRR